MRYKLYFLEIFHIMITLFYLILNTSIWSCARAENRKFFPPTKSRSRLVKQDFRLRVFILPTIGVISAASRESTASSKVSLLPNSAVVLLTRGTVFHSSDSTVNPSNQAGHSFYWQVMACANDGPSCQVTVLLLLGVHLYI